MPAWCLSYRVAWGGLQCYTAVACCATNTKRSVDPLQSMFIDSTANGYRIAPLLALQASFALSKASSIRCLHPARLWHLCWLVFTSIACKIKLIQTAAAPFTAFRVRSLGLRVDPLIYFLLQQVLKEIKRPQISGAISAGSCSFSIAPALSPAQRALTPPQVALGFDASPRRLRLWRLCTSP